MATPYGYVFTTGSIRDQLAEANRDYIGRKTWESLYGSVDLARQQQLGQLKVDYSKAVSDAYAAAYQSNAAIANSALGEGYKLAAMDDTDAVLQQAYDSYRANYLKGVSEVESNAAAATQDVTDRLTQQAEYTKQMADAPYQYLQYLFDEYSKGETEDNPFYENPTWSRFTNEVFDEEGNFVGRELKSWNDLAMVGARDEKTGEWLGLFDESGALTSKGTDFYDKVMNQMAVEGGSAMSFGNWLATNNEELFDWSQSYNPYDYTEAGTNVGTFKTLVGMTSTDEDYKFIERWGGLTESELDSMFTGFSEKLAKLDEKMNDLYKDKNAGKNVTVKNIAQDVKGFTDEIKNLTDSLGITTAIEKEAGISFEELSKALSDTIANSRTKEEIDLDLLGKIGLSTVAGGVGSATSTAAATKAAATAAKYGSKVLGTASKGAGPMGLVINMAIGLISGSIGARTEFDQIVKQGTATSQQIRNQYDQLVKALVSYSHEQRRKTQGDFYTANRLSVTKQDE